MKVVWNVIFLFIVSFVIMSFVYFSTMFVGGFEFDRKMFSFFFYFLCCFTSLAYGSGFGTVNNEYIAKDLKDYLFKGKEK